MSELLSIYMILEKHTEVIYSVNTLYYWHYLPWRQLEGTELQLPTTLDVPFGRVTWSTHLFLLPMLCCL